MRLTEKLNPPYERVSGEDYIYTSETRLTSSFAKVEQKLGKLEDIEEELGIDLVTLFKALSQGIYFKNEYSKEKEIVFARPTLSIHFELYLNPLCIFQLGSYGKTWALTREELESDLKWKD